MTNSGQLLSSIDFPPLPSNTMTMESSSSSKRISRSSKLRQNWFATQWNTYNSSDGGSNNNHHYQSSVPIYTPSDIFTIAFTGRFTFIIILRDSLCLTYTLLGKPVLDPFYIMNHGRNHTSSGNNIGSNYSSNNNTKNGKQQQQQQQYQPNKKATMIEVIYASIYDGGVAILCSNMTTAVVELLDSDEESDAFYRESSHVASRVVKSVDWDDGMTSGKTMMGLWNSSGGGGSSNPYSNQGDMNSSGGGGCGGGGNAPMDDEHNTTSMYVLITPLSTATHAKSNYITYTSIAVLPRIHTQSRHPEVFLGTSNNSVIVCDSSSNGSLMDVYCQERISSPIVKMKFSPNG